MITLMFLIIAFAMRGFFLHDNDTRGEKIFYYVACVVLTPLFDAILYKFLSESDTVDEKEHKPFIGSF